MVSHVAGMSRCGEPTGMSPAGRSATQFGAHTHHWEPLKGSEQGTDDGRCENRVGRVKAQKAKHSCCVPGLPVRGPQSPWSPCPPPRGPVFLKALPVRSFWEAHYLGRTRWTQQGCRCILQLQGCCASRHKGGRQCLFVGSALDWTPPGQCGETQGQAVRPSLLSTSRWACDLRSTFSFSRGRNKAIA